MHWWFRALFVTVSMQQKGMFVWICDNGWNLNPPFHSRVKSPVSWVDCSGWKASKATKMQASAGKVLASLFWDVQSILFINYLEKGRAINSIIGVFEGKNRKKKWPQMKKKKCSFTKIVHHVTSRWQHWKNYMNCTLNCFCPHPILQIWPPVITGYLQTSKECSRERDLTPMKKWYRKLRHILRPKTNCSTKKALNC